MPLLVKNIELEDLHLCMTIKNINEGLGGNSKQTKLNIEMELTFGSKVKESFTTLVS